MKLKQIFTVVFVVTICFTAFFLFSAVYLENADKKSKVSEKTESEPYYWVPTNSGLLFRFQDGENCLIYLDFEKSCVKAVFTDKNDAARIGDYSVDYTVDTDYFLLGGIIDRVGGINLKENGELLRNTGAQVSDKLSRSPFDRELKNEVLKQIFSEISKNGFSKDDFVYIIKNGGTDLLVPDCFYWEDYMKEISRDFEVIG